VPSRTYRPTGDGDTPTTQWVQFPASGNRYDKIDEEVSDGNTTYVSSDVSGRVVLTTIPQLPPGAKIIDSRQGCQSRGDRNHDPITYFRFRNAADANVSSGAFQTGIDGIYHEKLDAIRNNSPFTSSAWTLAEFNGCQFGIIQSHSGETRYVTQFWNLVRHSNDLVSLGGANNIIGYDGEVGLLFDNALTRAYGCKFTSLGTDGIFNNLMVRIGNSPTADGQAYKVAIFDSGGNLVGQGSTTKTASDGWKTCPLNSAIAIAANQDYYFFIRHGGPASLNIYRHSTHATLDCGYQFDINYADFPPATLPGLTANAKMFTMYGVLESGWQRPRGLPVGYGLDPMLF